MTVMPDRAVLLALHDEQLARYGGTAGLIDSAQLDAVLDSLLARAEADAFERHGWGIPALAASLALELLAERPFVDGNEGTAFAAMTTMLALNGYGFEVPEVEATLAVLGIASGEIDPADFSAWVQRRAVPAGRRAVEHTAAVQLAAP